MRVLIPQFMLYIYIRASVLLVLEACGKTSVSRLNAAFQSMNINCNSVTHSPCPHLTRKAKADYRDIGDESSIFKPPGTEVSSAPGTDKLLAQKDYETARLVLSDE